MCSDFYSYSCKLSVDKLKNIYILIEFMGSSLVVDTTTNYFHNMLTTEDLILLIDYYFRSLIFYVFN